MTQINASGEPMYSEVEEAMHMQNGQISPLSVNKTWQNQTRRTRHAQWFFDVWKATALYSGTGRPIDGFISYVSSIVHRCILTMQTDPAFRRCPSSSQC
jgi:hypothetical protein